MNATHLDVKFFFYYFVCFLCLEELALGIAFSSRDGPTKRAQCVIWNLESLAFCVFLLTSLLRCRGCCHIPPRRREDIGVGDLSVPRPTPDGPELRDAVVSEIGH